MGTLVTQGPCEQMSPPEMCLFMADIHKFKAYTEGLQHSMQCLTHQMHVLEIPSLLFLHTILA